MKPEYIVVEQHNNSILLGSLLLVPKDYKGGFLAPLSFFSQSNLASLENWEDVLLNIIRNIEATRDIDKYLIDNCHECFKIYTEFYDNRLFLKKLKALFVKTGILDRVVFTDNNLDLETIGGMPSKPYPYFLGWNAPSSPLLKKDKRKFSKKFLFMNRIDKFHRRWLLGRFISDDILIDMNWSYNVNNPDAYIHKVLGKSEQETGSEDVTYRLHDFIQNTFCHVICETNFNLSKKDSLAEGGYGTRNRFITEKTEKAFAGGNPFIAVTGYGYLKKLHELGFKTFSKWWDESYDDIVNPMKRLNAILSLIKDINKLDYPELMSMWNDMIPVLKHNQDLNKWYYIQGINSINTRFPDHLMANIKGLHFDLQGNETDPSTLFKVYKI